MELPDVDSFITQGEKLGYTDSALQKYVQQCIERFDRGKEKLERKAEAERLEREAEAERAERKAEAERLEREAEAERAEREAERQFELEKLRLERRTDASASNSNGSQVSRTLTHKIQEFKEDSDDINAFVRRFEAQAQTLKWPKDMWPLQMSTAFHGEALRLYDRLCVGGPVDYDELKKELLIKFQCTAEGFRDQFRSAKPEKEESMKSFHARLVGSFNSWIELSKNQKTYEGLYDLLIREQILQSVSRDLAVFLRERSFQNAQEMVESAEHYREAHKCRARRGDGLEFAGVSQSAGGGTRSPRTGGPRDGHPRSPRDRYIPGRGSWEVRPTGRSRATTNQTSPSRSPEKRSPTFKRKIQCYACKGFGHLARVCANTSTDIDKPDPRSSPKPASLGILCSSTNQADLGHLELYPGTVRGKTVQVLRDTGATTAGIRADLVQDHEYLGHNQACIMFGGNVETFPVAWVFVDTPFYKGYLKCCVIKNPVVDLIIGNVRGAGSVTFNLPEGDMASESSVTTGAQFQPHDRQLQPRNNPSVPSNSSSTHWWEKDDPGRPSHWTPRRQCYNCQRYGHIARNCLYQRAKYLGLNKVILRRKNQRMSQTEMQVDQKETTFSGNRHQWTSPRQCYTCEGFGHIAKECPNQRYQDPTSGNEKRRNQSQSSYLSCTRRTV